MARARSPHAQQIAADAPVATRIAVVDDDPDLRQLIDRLLGEAGYETVLLPDAERFRATSAAAVADLLILDVMLPGRSGLDLCRELRRAGNDVPVIMLTARDDEADRVRGFEVGADDYVTKPFSGRELVARIGAVLRRRQDGAARRAPRVRAFAGWTFRPDRMEIVSRDGLSIALSATEAALLETFLDNVGRTLSREDLALLTNGYVSGPFNRSLDTQVSRLRRKLDRGGAGSRADGGADDGRTASREPLIRTVWGRGYLFAAEVEDR